MNTAFASLQAICEWCRRLHERNLLAAGDGNISLRLDDGRIAITPSGVNKAWIKVGDLAYVNERGDVLSGRPSSERMAHVAVYQSCRQAKAVIHAHPPTLIAWTLAKPELTELPGDAMPESILAAGRIPVVPYARPGTMAMGEVLRPFLPDHRLLILARHGALAWGESLEEAYNGIERLEHLAQILKIAHDLGGFTVLPKEEVIALRGIREKMGPKLL